MKNVTKSAIGILTIILGSVMTLTGVSYESLLGLTLMLVGMGIAMYYLYAEISSKLTKEELEDFAEGSAMVIIASS